MKNNIDCNKIYKSRDDSYSQDLQELDKRLHLLSNTRLGVVLATIGICYYLYNSIALYWVSAIAVIGALLFFLLVIICSILKDKRIVTKEMIIINREGSSRSKGEFSSFKDTGEDFIDNAHPYSSDLDLFGSDSLFQKFNTARTFYGRQKVAAAFNGKIVFDTISAKQKAISELASLVPLRQNIELEGRLNSSETDPSRLTDWFSKITEQDTIDKFSKLFLFLPFISLITFMIEFFLIDSLIVSTILYSCQLFIGLFFYGFISQEFSIFEGRYNQLTSFSKTIAILEEVDFQSAHLQQLKEQFKSENNTTASTTLKRIVKILSRAELRKNTLPHFFINTILLWDIRIILQAREWKNQYGDEINTWLETVGDFECIASLSVIAFENPTWSFADVCDDTIIKATNLSHPLLEKSIAMGNDYSMNDERRVNIISGSNMSGKSTFLRTVAVNLVLAYCGAPVSASSMHCGYFTICSSMRANDNLTDNVSTFYSELLKIKTIVDASKNNKNLFFVIDEIFSGTNSHDRIIGAREVLKLLHREGSLGMISTHDLELCSLEKEKDKQFFNTHFKEYFKENEILFDYQLREGESQTRNALHLIKMAGIPINEN